MDFIERLRQKPSSTKRTIAFGTSAVITLAIFGVWASVLHFGSGIGNADVTASVAESEIQNSESDVNPLEAFWSVISKGWDGLSNSINQIKNTAEDAKKIVGALGEASSSTVSTSVNIEKPVPKKVSEKINSPESDVFILGDTTQ